MDPNSSTRAKNLIDDTTNSITPSFRSDIELSAHSPHVLTTEATAQEILHRYLSSDTVVSTTRPFTQRYQETQFGEGARLFSEIGHGTYGIVFERPGTFEVVKRAINPDAPIDTASDLWNDFMMHTIIYESFQKVSYHRIHITRPLQFISVADSDGWSIWREKFDEEWQRASNLLLTERILSVPKPVRDALADLFCPEPYRMATEASMKNKHCLIAPVVGRRKGNYTLRGLMNLRNYELCVDQMEQLGLDIDGIIDVMAESMAIMHHQAHVDAHDVEFVFGTAPTSASANATFDDLQKMTRNSSVKSPGRGFNFHGRVVHLWMLDFNRVTRILSKEHFVPMALRGFTNQSKAYYPRPRSSSDKNTNTSDLRYWSRFKDAYLRASAGILGEEDDDLDLPRQFLKAVEDHYDPSTRPSGEK